MNANEFVFRSVVAILIILALVSIQRELESIADSLKILASPPQIEERF
jgi:hypothetical protein